MDMAVEDRVYGVYIMKIKGLYKVGMSSNIETRVRSLKSELLNFVEIGTMSEALFCEKQTHKRLMEYCVKNEYFDCDYKTVHKAYCDVIFNWNSNPINDIMYVDLKPLYPPACDGTIPSILERFKYLVNA